VSCSVYEDLSWDRTAQKRKDLEPLCGVRGTVIHDHWKPYYQLPNVEPGLCNAHRLRELKARSEIKQESWAKSMTKLWLLANQSQHRYEDRIWRSHRNQTQANLHFRCGKGVEGS
jgi:transposase